MSEASSAFGLLHERVQNWIWTQNWNELRDAQEKAIPLLLHGDQDVIIAAATAAGKTEAAFLPIASSFLNSNESSLALCISPLKALITDQHLRLSAFLESLDLACYPWHGDVGAKKKQDFEKKSEGVLLITPESLESLFVRKGFYIGHLLRHVRFVVIDELHSFIGSERGAQVASQLNRIEEAVGRRVPRVGLSATLGDLSIAQQFLRPRDPGSVAVVESKASGQELRILIKGYQETPPERLTSESEVDEEDSVALAQIAKDAFKAFRGTKNLVFANSRKMVEEFTSRLNGLCEDAKLPNEFFAHHGSLAKELREDVESILKEPSRPATAICTSTLEMGIDIGTVRSVGQISPPFSVASLRQRLGRSGRRGEPSILRAFVVEPALAPDLAMQDQLRLDLVQSIACVELVLQRWCEPPVAGQMHLSTLVHQLLSIIAEKGGVRADDAFRTLCRRGPFELEASSFAKLLRGLAAQQVIVQSEDGTLLHGLVGEKIVNHYTFYPTFWSTEEFRVVHGGKALGSICASQPVAKNSLILFAGRRWRVLAVDERSRTIDVAPAQGGRAPKFAGGVPGTVHARIHQEMFRIYTGREVPPYLDETGRSLLAEGRDHFANANLAHRRLVAVDGGTLVFLWAGDRVANTLLAQLQAYGFAVETFGVGLMVADVEPEILRGRFQTWLAEGPPRPEVIAEAIPNKIMEKFDALLPMELLAENYGRAILAPADTWAELDPLAGESRQDFIQSAR